MEDNRAYSVDDELMHYARGQRARNHKYIAIKNGRYIYPADVGGAYQNITETARRGFNTINDVQRRAGEGLNSFLNSQNEKQHAREAARQERIQKALDEATKKAEARKKKKEREEKDALESIMDPFRRVENRRKRAERRLENNTKRIVRTYKNEIEKPIANELDRQKKVHTQLKKERQEKITNVKNTLDNLPNTVQQRGREEINFWLSPSRKTSKTVNPKGFYANGTWYKDGDSYVRSQEKKAAANASKRNTSAQRSSAMKEKSSSAHRSASSRAQARKRSAAKNKQRIANAKASRAR